MKKITVLVPLTYNDGTAVPVPVLRGMEQAIFMAFGGWTNAGEVTGAYRMRATGLQHVERLNQYWIVVPETSVDALREMVAEFAATLGQEAMYFEIAESTVEYVRPRPEQGNSHD